MSDYLAGIDPNHLITVGEEGFYGPENNAKNPAPEAGEQRRRVLGEE